MWEFLPAALTIAGSLNSFMGNNASASAAADSGRRVQAGSLFQATQLDQQAGQSIASSQIAALDQARQGRLLASRALAVAAASGGGATDPTITRLISNIAGESAYRSATALYQGEDRARLLRMEADAKRYEGDLAVQSGDAKASAYRSAAIGSLFSAGGTLFSKYGMGSTSSPGTGTATAASVIDAGTPNFTMAG